MMNHRGITLHQLSAACCAQRIKGQNLLHVLYLAQTLLELHSMFMIHCKVLRCNGWGARRLDAKPFSKRVQDLSCLSSASVFVPRSMSSSALMPRPLPLSSSRQAMLGLPLSFPGMPPWLQRLGCKGSSSRHSYCKAAASAVFRTCQRLQQQDSKWTNDGQLLCKASRCLK